MLASPLMRGMMMRQPMGAIARRFADGGPVGPQTAAAPAAPTRLSLTPDLLQRLTYLQPDVRYGNPLTMQRNSEFIDKMEELRRRAEIAGIGASGYAQGGRVEDPTRPSLEGVSTGPMPPLGYGTRPLVPWQTTAGAPFARGGLSTERREAPAPGGALRHATGPGGGQDDKIKALLSDGEVVWPADVVSHVGDGSNNEGARRLMAAADEIRAEKAASSKGGRFPAKAKPPLNYIEGRGKKKASPLKKAEGGAVKDDELPPLRPLGLRTSPTGAVRGPRSEITGVRG